MMTIIFEILIKILIFFNNVVIHDFLNKDFVQFMCFSDNI